MTVDCDGDFVEFIWVFGDVVFLEVNGSTGGGGSPGSGCGGEAHGVTGGFRQWRQQQGRCRGGGSSVAIPRCMQLRKQKRRVIIYCYIEVFNHWFSLSVSVFIEMYSLRPCFEMCLIRAL